MQHALLLLSLAPDLLAVKLGLQATAVERAVQGTRVAAAAASASSYAPLKIQDSFEAVCEVESASLWNGFLIRGDDATWDPVKLQRDHAAQGLLDNLRGCGWVTDWGWQANVTGNQDWQAWGKLPWWPKGEPCIPKAIRDAGGPDVRSCFFKHLEGEHIG